MAAGLTSAEARRRLAEFGENRIRNERRAGVLTLFIAQFKSPIILILVGAAIVSLFLQDRTDAALILAIRSRARIWNHAAAFLSHSGPDHSRIRDRRWSSQACFSIASKPPRNRADDSSQHLSSKTQEAASQSSI
jgi:hypothetical protein